ncbi:ABC-type transport auxiliary lipoprotein family protein [Paracoccus benzoatiresistens]|uniref:ABC-type transport auxiliary lipoprotein family protein n=1 Tax=Paracoccus benzoatiresistens TaxID=2997341 RepID=A0ABT4J9C9_9RHOB|nr:ABC-type transport auxiliary lipoprotein family protein [Paracoccus sp. EF6]MCZ0963739.1 ABC-type transport auxiliary lipoprotein family protein [Paracoccus sp. EF6]
MRLSTTVLAFGLCILSGCGTLSAMTGGPERDVFELRPPAPATGCGRASIGELIIEPPKARSTLDSDRIMIRPSALQTQYLPDAQWGEAVPEMLQRLLVQSLGATGSFGYVGRAPLGISGDYALISEIEDFNAELTAEGVVVRLTVNAQMVSELEADIVSRGRFAAAVPAAGTRTADLIPAFDAAARQLVTQMTEWGLRASGVNPRQCQ